MEQELLDVKKQQTTDQGNCGHEEVINALEAKISDMESINTAISMQCQQLQEKLEQTTSKPITHCR